MTTLEELETKFKAQIAAAGVGEDDAAKLAAYEETERIVWKVARLAALRGDPPLATIAEELGVDTAIVAAAMEILCGKVDMDMEPVRYLVLAFCDTNEQRDVLGRQLHTAFVGGVEGGRVSWLVLPGNGRLSIKVIDLAQGKTLL